MSFTPFIKCLLLTLLTPVRGVQAFILGCCCFNSVDNLSLAADNAEEINPADFSYQWKQLWHCAGNSWLAKTKSAPFISPAHNKDISTRVRLGAQQRQVLKFSNLSTLVSQLRCCHRLSGAPTTDAHLHHRFSLLSTTRYFAVVLFLCLPLPRTRGFNYVFNLCRCMSDRCCPYLYGRGIS